jgi:hypothetical protein
MAKEAKTSPSTSDLVRKSLLYQHFRAELEEIHRHKWYESEKAGHDIGFERALTEWSLKHRSAWLKHRQRQLQATSCISAPRTDLGSPAN